MNCHRTPLDIIVTTRVEEVGSWRENSSASGGIATRHATKGNRCHRRVAGSIAGGARFVDLIATLQGTFRLRLAHRPIGMSLGGTKALFASVDVFGSFDGLLHLAVGGELLLASCAFHVELPDALESIRMWVKPHGVVGREQLGFCRGAWHYRPALAIHVQRDHGGLVRRVDDRDDVVLPLCPVVLLDRAAKFCGEFLIMARSIGGILDVKDTFIREIDQRDVGRHSVSFRFEALAPLRSPTARRRSRHFLILQLFQAQASCALIDINSRSSFLTVSGEEPPARWPIGTPILFLTFFAYFC